MKTREEWISLFETVIGRPPSADEIEAASLGNFDPKQIVAISEGKYPVVGNEQTVNPVEASVPTAADVVSGQSTPDTGMNAVPTAQEQVTQPQAVPTVHDVVEPDYSQNTQAQDVNPTVPTAGQVQPAAVNVNGGIPSSQPVQGEVSNKENIVLPIISFVISGLTLLLCLFVKSPFALISLGFISAVFGVLSFVLNFKKSKKLLSTIALPLSIGALVIGVSLGFYQSVATASRLMEERREESDKIEEDDTLGEDVDDSRNSKSSGSYSFDDLADKDGEPYEWTEDEIVDLPVVGLYGSNGSEDAITLDDFIDEYGKGTDANISDGYISVDYNSEESPFEVGTAASFTFNEDDNGDYVLTGAKGIGLGKELKINKSYTSNWTQADVDGLKEGDYDDVTSGAKWSDIQKKYGDPSEGYYTITNHGHGVEYGLHITYTDYDATGDKLDHVTLTFRQDGNEYYLNYKYPPADK